MDTIANSCLRCGNRLSREGVRQGLKPKQSDSEGLPPHPSLLTQKDHIKLRLQVLQEALSGFPTSQGALLSLNPDALFSPGSPVHLTARALLPDVYLWSTLTHTFTLSLWVSYYARLCSRHEDMVVNGQGKIPAFTELPF